MVRPFYGGLGAAQWRAEQPENKKPRVEAGLEVGESPETTATVSGQCGCSMALPPRALIILIVAAMPKRRVGRDRVRLLSQIR